MAACCWRKTPISAPPSDQLYYTVHHQKSLWTLDDPTAFPTYLKAWNNKQALAWSPMASDTPCLEEVIPTHKPYLADPKTTANQN